MTRRMGRVVLWLADVIGDWLYLPSRARHRSDGHRHALVLSVEELRELLAWDDYVEQEGGFGSRSANPLRDKIEAAIKAIETRT